MLKAEKTGVFQAPQTLREEDYLVADAAVLRLPGLLSLPGIMLPVPVQSRNEQSIEQLLLCRKSISTFASSMSCQSCQLMWRSCCNPVHIDHQYWRKGRHAGVSQWPLCEKHSLHSFLLYYFQGSNQWRVSPLQCWKPRKLELGRHPHTLFWEDCLVAASVWRLSGIPALPGIMLPVPVPSKNEQGIEQLLLCRKNTSTCASSMSCQSCQLMRGSCSNPVHIDHHYWRKGRHAGVSQWPLCENHSLHSLHPRQSSDQWRLSPSQCWKLKKLDFGRCRKPCVKRILGCWCCCVMASMDPVATRDHVACSSSEQKWAEHWTTFAVPEEYKHLR